MKTKFKSVFKALRRPLLPVFLGCLMAPVSGFSGSLWREAVTDERGMFADKRAHRLGDIVMVQLDEVFNSTNALTLDTAKTDTGGSKGVTNFLYSLVNGVKDSQGQGQSKVGKFPSNLVPKLLNDGSVQRPGYPDSTDKNTATVSSKQTLNSLGMSVQIIDVLPNGNLVIEGIREIAFSNERQYASLRGIIRPTDIKLGNTISSNRIADARIDVVSEGDLSVTQKKGWLKRLDDKISPY